MFPYSLRSSPGRPSLFRKCAFTRRRFTKVSFVFPTHQKSSRRLLREVHYCGRNANFFLKNMKRKKKRKRKKKNRVKRAKLVAFNPKSSKLREHEDQDESKVPRACRRRSHRQENPAVHFYNICFSFVLISYNYFVSFFQTQSPLAN